MNNQRGQVFVGFVLLLPLIIMMFAYVVDNGIIMQNKTKLDEITKNVITYALEHREKDITELEKYISLNETNIDNIEIILDEDVQIRLTKTVEAIFGQAIGMNEYQITSYYEGEVKDGEIIIRKIEKE